MINSFTYYDILEISPTASEEVIKAAYKALVKRYHPDSMNHGDSSKTMTQINEAYETLSDAVKRERYDQILKQNKQASSMIHTEANPLNTTNTEKNGGINESWALRFFKGLGKSILSGAEQWNADMENAYIEGKKMKYSVLIYKYKQAKGAERIGYQKVLEEKGLLCRNDDGMYVPTDTFHYYERNYTRERN